MADAKKAAEDAEAKKDVFYLLIAVLGTLLFISALMVLHSSFPSPPNPANTTQIGAAYLAGARFDVAVSELKKGKFFPKHTPGSDEAQHIVDTHDHGEL